MLKPSTSPQPAAKSTASFDLATVKAAFSSPNTLRMTNTARSGMIDLGLQETDVVSIVQSLGDADFHKTMPSEQKSSAWQDVYKTAYKGDDVYVKFTDNANGMSNLVVLSFKRK